MRSLQTLIIPALLAAFLAVAGCANDTHSDDHDHGAPVQDDHGHDHGAATEADAHGHDAGHDESEHPTVAVTLWTPRMELFMEYPEMVVNEPARFIIHLTVLDGFQPVRDGSVTLTFTAPDGHTHAISEDHLLREGIFAPTAELHDAGPHQFELTYTGPGLSDTFTIADFVVYSSLDAMSHDHEEDAGDEITFLKEQQWKVPFATAEVELHEMKRGARAVAEVLPTADGYAEIIAPVAGIVRTAGGVAAPGAEVNRGTSLASIEPPVGGDGWTSARLAYEHAKQDYERVQRLRERDAVSEHEYDEVRTTYLTLQAGIDASTGDSDSNNFTLRAPFAGRVIDWQVRSGQYVNAGDRLMAVVDPGTVWLRADVYEDDYAELGQLTGIWVKSSGSEGSFGLDASQLSLLSRGGTIDPHTRTIPVLLQVSNPVDRLRIGERVAVELYSSDGELVPSVPETAVLDDNGMEVVFVQAAGESFVKRNVTLGATHMGHVAILRGLDAGERVVTEGGYLVKLASSSTEIGHGHAH